MRPPTVLWLSKALEMLVTVSNFSITEATNEKLQEAVRKLSTSEAMSKFVHGSSGRYSTAAPMETMETDIPKLTVVFPFGPQRPTSTARSSSISTSVWTTTKPMASSYILPVTDLRSTRAGANHTVLADQYTSAAFTTSALFTKTTTARPAELTIGTTRKTVTDGLLDLVTTFDPDFIKTRQLWERLWNYSFSSPNGFSLENSSVELSSVIAELHDIIASWTYCDLTCMNLTLSRFVRVGRAVPLHVLMQMEDNFGSCDQFLRLPSILMRKLSNDTVTGLWYPLTSKEGLSYSVGDVWLHNSYNYTLIGFTSRDGFEFPLNTSVHVLVYSNNQEPTSTAVGVTTDPIDSFSLYNCEIDVRLPKSLVDLLIPVGGHIELSDFFQKNFAKGHPTITTAVSQIWIEISQRSGFHTATIQNLVLPDKLNYTGISIISRVISLDGFNISYKADFMGYPPSGLLNGSSMPYRFQEPISFTVYGLPLTSTESSLRYLCGHYNVNVAYGHNHGEWSLENGCQTSTFSEVTFTDSSSTYNVSALTCHCYYFGWYAVFRATEIQPSAGNLLDVIFQRVQELHKKGQSSAVLLQQISAMLEQLENVAAINEQSALQTILEFFQIGNVIELPSIAEVHNKSGLCNRLMTLRDKIASSIKFYTNNSDEIISATTKDFSVTVTRLSKASRFIGMASFLENNNLHKIIDNKSMEIPGEKQLGSSITLPDSLVDYLIKLSEHKEIRMWFEVSRNSTIYNATMGFADNATSDFPNSSPRQFALASFVTGASISVGPVINWTDFITIRLKILYYHTNFTYTCAYWDIYANKGFGAWSTNGCKSGGIDNTYMTCFCNHLTSFGILVDASGLSGVSPATTKILSAITYVALIISIIALTVVITMTFLIRNFSNLNSRSITKRFNDKDFVIINLCLSLILTYAVFLGGIDQLEPRELCMLTGIILHWLFLVSFAWLAVEGLLLFKTFAAQTLPLPMNHFQLRSGLLCWILPFLLIATNLIIDYDAYGYGLVKACWLDALYASLQYYLTVILPICLILAWNLIVFILVAKQLISTKLKIRCTKINADLSIQLRRCAILFVLLGLPWMLLLVNIFSSSAVASTVMNVLITIFCGTQGIGILAIQIHGTKTVLRRISKTLLESRSTTRTRSTIISSQIGTVGYKTS
ncbi:uncharacterized protein LOC129593474 isoform X2 [Paramacrobiotus metropolitanus]|uniref:uncharacterized protein LOC129593474 isoform X2 n=1 Tax=Paramacrobiotus metropolitanus TaxID=2943436 RepID=UPI002445F746|nr:uncharacterized protein LOC129593474 isoform X2 [Paramacrobiotus metropolitanus]